MDKPFPIQEEMQRVTGLVRRYFICRMQRESINLMSEIIRDLRVSIQHVVTNYFFHLPQEKGRQFQTSLADQLNGICEGFREQCGEDDHKHHKYCMREVMACFEWAEQIKAEVPDDPITQKVLAVDIPILRPFDYGLGKAKPVARPSKKR